MALDRQSIEKKDFPLGRRGYEPDAVDAHLAELADEVSELRRSTRTRGDTLAASASDQVRAIVEAAETSAAEIQRSAEGDAREIRDEASAEARDTRAQATAQAREYVDSVAASTESLLARLGSMQTELDSLLGSLRTGAGRLSTDLGAIQADLEEMSGAIPSRPAFEPDLAAPEVLSGTEPAAEDGFAVAAEDPFGEAFGGTDELAGADESDLPPSPTSDEEIEGARLIALNMALNGTPREETARYLDENFVIADSAVLLDEVYASVEA